MGVETDVAVVGAGIVGLFVAAELAERGIPVTVYERAAPGGAQSGGDSRIFRHGHDDVRLVALAQRSLGLWREWEARLGAELLAADGVVVLGPRVEERMAVFAEADGVRARMIGAAEVAERLPILAPWTGPAMLDEDGGVIRTRAAVAGLAGRLGAALVAEEVVTVRPTRHGTVELRALGAVVEHERVVVCAGRDTARLAAGAGLALPVRHTAHVRVAYALRDAAPARLACLLDGGGAFGEPGAYGDPLPGNGRYAIGLHDVPARADGSLLDAADLTDAMERTTAYVARGLPGLVPAPVEVRHCWVTDLPWNHDAMAAWEAGGLTFFAGNNLFKHAPAIGRALADACAGGPLGDLRPEARLGEPQPAA